MSRRDNEETVEKKGEIRVREMYEKEVDHRVSN